ncbi:cation channel sperm-associated targeting subunit tau [Eublepharis macularius]|uniref:Cation channel sperm-associated targeting subunit tau n=1 Tax=Eublepharis macularius TaxID=481883 RepID=A0AA97IV22_EUBMA|nr:cation channel sperm-associated targeting subunit tau [Eublepharis macularius]
MAGAAAAHKESLELPAGEARGRRSSWRESICRAVGGRGASQSLTSRSSELSSGPESSAASAFSRLSVATLLGLSGLGPSASGTTDQPKTEKARSLLRLLLRNQKSPENSGSELNTDIHNLIPCGDVVGLLAVSVKQLKDFTPKFNVKRDTSLLIRISIDKIMKCTNPQVYRANQKSSKKITTIYFGDVRYFSVKVPNQKSDCRNRIVLELVGFEGPKDFPRLFGTVTMHLYEVIQRQSFTEICAVRIRNMVFCMAEVEFMFCYGCFGYGYSHQLKLPGADPAKAVACSMFMRVPPPKDRKDQASNVIKPQLMDYPAFLSPDLNVTVGNVELEAPIKDSEDYQTLQNALKEPPRERLVKMKQEYRSLKTWREKAEYLDQLILKRGPKTKPGLTKVSRFKQMVGKVQHPVIKESASDSAPETVLHEEKQPEFMADLLSAARIPVMPSTISEIPVSSRQRKTYSDTDSERECGLPPSADTLPSVPALTVTSSGSAASHVPSDIMGSFESKIRRTEISRESETSLSSSGGVPAEFSDGPAEAGDSESTAVGSLGSRAAEEEPPPPAKQSPRLMQESHFRSEAFVEVPDEAEAPKPPESANEILPQWPWKEIEFQEAVFSGDKFEPFLRHIRGVQPPVLPEGKVDETSIFGHLENTRPYVEIKEQEDQDPPRPMPPTKAVSSSGPKLVQSGEQLSILRLIEKKIELEEEEPQLAIQKDEEPNPWTVEPDLPQKPLEKFVSEPEVKQVHISFKRSVEDFLVNRLINVIALKSLLSKNVENLVEERLLEAEVSEELEDSMDTVESLPDEKRKHLLGGRQPRSGERLSEVDIRNLKTVASQNLQANLIGKLSAHGIISGMELAENNQKVSTSSSLEEDLLQSKKHLSKETISQTDIITLKSLSDLLLGDSSKMESAQSSQEDQRGVGEPGPSESKMDDGESALGVQSQSCSVEGTNTEAGLGKECLPKSLEIIRVRLPMSTETELTKKSLSEPEVGLKSDPNKTVNDTVIEKLLKAELVSLKSFLSKGLQDHFKDKLSETGLSTKEDFEKVCQKLSLNVKDELTTALEKALPGGGQVSSKESLPELCAVKGQPVFNESIRNFLLETLSESEIANLKSVLNKKIQDHLLERLSEIGLITEEELIKVLENFFPVVAQEALPGGVNEKISFEKEKIARSVSSLTQSLQDRFSEEELKNLKSLLNRLLKEDHRDRLSESDIKGLTSVLQKNFKDLPIQSSSETGISREVEIKDGHSRSLLTIEESSPEDTTVGVAEKEKCYSKDSLSKMISDEKLGLGEKPDLSVNGVFDTEAMNKETQTNGFISPPKKLAMQGEKPDPSIDSVWGTEKHSETQTTDFIVPPKKVKQSSKKESDRLQSSDKPDMPNPKKRYETIFKNKLSDDSLKRTPEPFTSSSFLSAHDIGVQTEIKNYLSRPPGYLPKPTFPVNPQTFLFLHSESEEEARPASKLPHKSRRSKRPDQLSKKDAMPHYLQQVVVNTPVKKEKTTGRIMPKDVLKEKGRKHCEPPFPKLTATESKRDMKTTAAPGVARKESLKQKSEKKRDEIRPRKSFSKIAVLSDPQPQNVGGTPPDKPSATQFPGPWRTKGNAPVRTGIV